MRQFLSSVGISSRLLEQIRNLMRVRHYNLFLRFLFFAGEIPSYIYRPHKPTNRPAAAKVTSIFGTNYPTIAGRTRQFVSRISKMRLVNLTLLLTLCLSASVVSSEPEILVNQRLAKALSLKTGDVIEISASGDMKDAQEFK